MQPSKCNTADLIIQAAQTMQSMAYSAQINLNVKPASIEIFADSDRILQALTNLLSNAIKFSQPGQTVELRSMVNSNYLQIEIQDQGRGIPPDKQQLIFERFQQVDASDSRSKGGTGLGLPICRSIIEQHKGQIWVESILGKGSTFYILLPIRNG